MATVRTKVGVVEIPATVRKQPSPAFDELTGTLPRLVEIPLEYLHPHPHNPRRDLGDLTELAASIKAAGIHQPLTVVPHYGDVDFPDQWDGNSYRTVIGHRRAAAAALAGLTAVPAIVDESLSAAQQLELMLVENVQRADLTAVEEADGYQGLLDLGLDVDDIVSKTGSSASTVRRRLQLVALPESTREKVHLHQGTLGDAELLAETLARPDVAAHPEIVEELTDAYGTRSRFADFVAERVGVVELVEAQAQMAADLQAKGVRVIPQPPYDDKKIKPLSGLSAGEEHYGPKIETKRHAKCPGHVAWVGVEYGYSGARVATTIFGCDDWKAQGHFDRTVSHSGAGAGKASTEQRRTLIANNKAAAAARPVRLEWIRTVLLDRLDMPAGSVMYVAALLTVGRGPDYRETSVHREILTGDDHTVTVQPPATTDSDALWYLVAHALAVAEALMFEKDWWTKKDNRRALMARHLRYLAANGYGLADVERTFLADKATPHVDDGDVVVTPDGEVLAGGPEILHEVDDEDLEDDVDDEGDEG